MLNDLPKLVENSKKRVGRGYGSGKGGHTVGRGQKGQKSRSGYRRKVGFEGGQLPLYRRLPRRRGWGNKPVSESYSINLGRLNEVFKEGEKVNAQSLAKKGFLPHSVLKSKRTTIKILGQGELTKKLVFEGVFFSASAQKKISSLVAPAEKPQKSAK